jgi:hypothetical protein
MGGSDDKPENYHTVTYDLAENDGKTTVTLTQDNNATQAEADKMACIRHSLEHQPTGKRLAASRRDGLTGATEIGLEPDHRHDERCQDLARPSRYSAPALMASVSSVARSKTSANRSVTFNARRATQQRIAARASAQVDVSPKATVENADRDANRMASDSDSRLPAP